MLNEAALECVRRQGSLVCRADIYNGMDRILQVPLPPRLSCSQSPFAWHVTHKLHMPS